MQIKQSPPLMAVYDPTRDIQYGFIKNPIEFTEDIRLNSASEINFSIPNKYYDDDSQTWIRNSIYDDVIENNLLYLHDDNNYFAFPTYKPMSDTEYSTKKANVNLERDTSQGGVYNPNQYEYFNLQNETKLFDIGSSEGYGFNHMCFLSNSGNYYNVSQERFWRLLTCDSFIPVNAGDVLYLNSDKYDNDNEWLFSFRFCCYKDAKGIKCTYQTEGELNERIPLPVNAFTAQGTPLEMGKLYAYTENENGEVGSWYAKEYGVIAPKYISGVKPGYIRYRPNKRIPITKSMLGGQESGYIRISIYVAGDKAERKTVEESDGYTTTSWHWVYPEYDYIKLFSRERKCKTIEVKEETPNKLYEPKLKWFVIQNIEEHDDGFKKVKTVKAYTYEYTLSKRLFSISEDTLPFYIPPSIKDIVESSEWLVEYADDENLQKQPIYYPQKLKTGILNLILDSLPDWQLKYISSELMTRYRLVSDVDDVDLYSYCTQDLQQLYQCFFVFDSNDKSISVYTFEDIRNLSVNPKDVYFTWDNIIKSLDVVNSDSAYVTALRVHSSEDTYSIGLINATGNNIIYNFDYIKPQLKKIPVSNGGTLWDRIDSWEKEYHEYMKSDEYKKAGHNLISLMKQQLEVEAKLSSALTDYHKVADEINIHLENDYRDNLDTLPTSYYIGETPRTPNSMMGGVHAPISKYANYHSKALYKSLLSLSKQYYTIEDSLKTILTDINTEKGYLKYIASYLTFNPNISTYTYDGKEYTPFLSDEERSKLLPYIIEGTWTNEDIVFNEEYSDDDIYNTLQDMYQLAKTDLATRLNSPTFEFSFNLANPLVLSEMKLLSNAIKIGYSYNIEIASNNHLFNVMTSNKYVYPTLIEIHLDYKDQSNTKFTFSTDYKRKPLEYRFADLFNSLNSVSPKSKSFTYEE